MIKKVQFSRWPACRHWRGGTSRGKKISVPNPGAYGFVVMFSLYYFFPLPSRERKKRLLQEAKKQKVSFS